MKKILIIGKDSYIGQKFIAKQYEGFQIDEFDSTKPLNKEVYKGYDVVLHLAGIAHVSNKKNKSLNDLYMKVNRDLAIESCDLAKEAGVKQFIFMSSMIIYGDDKRIGKPFIINEDTKPNPSNIYGRSKLEADLYIQSQNSSVFKTLVIRSPMVYGEGCKGNYPKLLKLANKLPILPRIHNKRSVISIENLVNYYFESINKETSGVGYPQDDKYMDTTAVMVESRKANGKKSYQSVLLGLTVRIASLFIRSFRKMYSTKIYKRDAS